MAILDIAASAREIASVPYQIASRMTLATDANTAEYRSIQYAVKKYSALRPRKLAVEVTPTGVWEYDLTTIVTGWKKSSYRVTDIIYPYSATSTGVYTNVGYFDQNKLDKQDWTVVLNPTQNNKPYLRFLNSCPAASSTEKMWIYYDSPQVVSATLDTITDEEDGDVEAFCFLVASRLLFIASNYFARLDDATVDIATVDNQLKSNTYNQRSKDAEKVFMDHMKENIEHSGRIDWDFFSSDSEDRFWIDSRLT